MKTLLLFCTGLALDVAVFAASTGLAGLRDHPIAAAEIKYLDGSTWTAAAPSAGLRINATVPGDLITDLQVAGLVRDPLKELNWLKPNSNLWSQHSWTYRRTFSADDISKDQASVMLVLDSVKMGAYISLNHKQLGVARDQFVRYTYNITELLQSGSNSNVLELTFPPDNADDSIDVQGRFMACTGGWDWAAYSDVKDQHGTRTLTKGIAKSVYLARVPHHSVAITHVVPQVRYLGSYPTSPLAEGKHAGFQVTVIIHILAASNIPAGTTLKAQSTWGSVNQTVLGAIPAGNSVANIVLVASAEQVKLWWPQGVGKGIQPLYDVKVSLLPSASDPVLAVRQIGFRTFALVTGNDTNPEYVKASKGVEGTSDFTMFFRVNGVAVWARGANVIPMESLEGRLQGQAHKQLVTSAAAGGMNTLRVWGGGVFLPTIFYETCDQLGLMVMQDMAYAQEGHAPKRTRVQEEELRHQVRRLSHHASIVMWDGCNECKVVMGTETEIYASFVMTTVAQEDQSRVVWPSCPALGWSGGVDRLWALPSGLPLKTPSHGAYIELHGPYQHGSGFPAMNGATPFDPVKLTIPLELCSTCKEKGLGEPSIFASEFGCVVMSSFESMSPTLAPEHWSLHGGAPPDTCQGYFENTCNGTNVMAQRNYPCDSLIIGYFGGLRSDLDEVGELAFKSQLYKCMLAQMLHMQGDIAQRRAGNSFGTLIWQLNEIWPTGGWGSLEYGTTGWTNGQVLGGRWKPLHYLLRRALYADVLVTCGLKSKAAQQTVGVCYAVNDGAARQWKGRALVEWVPLGHGSVSTVLVDRTIHLPAGPGAIEWFELDLSKLNISEGVLVTKAVTSSVPQVAESEQVLPLVAPKDLQMASTHVDAHVVLGGRAVLLRASRVAPALWVVLTTQAQGRFSDNAVLLRAGEERQLNFEWFGDVNEKELTSTLRVEHAAQYMLGESPSKGPIVEFPMIYA